MNKRIDGLILILLPLLAAIIVTHFKINLLVVSVLLFFIAPSAYLGWRNPGILAKSLKFAILFSIPMMLFVDTLAAVNGSWIIPVTIFPVKIFGISTIDNYFFAFGWALFAVLFYEHFFDKAHHGEKLSSWFRGLLYFFAVICSSMILLFYRDQRLLKFPYFYLLIGIFSVFLPLVLFLFYYPKYLQRFATLAIYFFFMLTVYEISALKTGEWIFAGHYIGYVQLLDSKFPFEEFFIWTLVATPSLLAYYEFFADHNKLTAKRF